MNLISTVFYHILICPIEYMIEVCFSIMNQLLDHEGYAIIAIGITVSTLVLPLYLWADGIQAKEHEKQLSMEHWISHIRKSFQGDERYMMINTYYAEQGYRPIYALRGLIPLFLQIPFFIAAYHFLSNLQRLQGLSFGSISDLGSPDGLLTIGNTSVHLLPILMTFFNFLSTAIYTRGFTLKQKLQPYLLALLFLVLLYNSPSGLVLYWTTNNLYSLCKNLITKYIKKPKRFIGVILFLTALLYAAYLFRSGRISYAIYWKDLEILLLYVICFIGLLLTGISLFMNFHPQPSKRKTESSDRSGLFLFSSISLTILLGVYIPLLVISVSPMDFLILDTSTNPLHYMFFALQIAAGYFLIWNGLIYLMLPKKNRNIYSQILFFLLLSALINAFFFKADVGYVSTMLEFDILPHFSLSVRIINLLLLFLLLPLCIFLCHRFRSFSLAFTRIILLSLCVMSIRYAVLTRQKIHDINVGAKTEEYIVPLSAEGKNVILIMLDRGVSGYIPFMFDEKPELKDQFAGFTYYPNTISFGTSTEEGAPALYGGYDYSLERIKERDTVSQHNEALCVLPVLFGEAGYQVTVTDPAFADPDDIDYSIFDPYPYISAYSLEHNLPTGYDLNDFIEKRERNFFFYSLYRIAPAILQKNIYDTGGYLAADRSYFLGEDNYRYGHTVLKNLPDITRLMDDDTNRYLAFTNNTAHAHVLLSLPDYDDRHIPDYTGMDINAPRRVDNVTLRFDPENEDTSVGSYHANMSAFLGLGEWFDYLREIGVYDNCRIVLVADHGSSLADFDEFHLSDKINITPNNPVLLVKDFDSDTPFTTDMRFMTNADTPALLTNGLINDPTNPFTGHLLDMSGKTGGVNILSEDNSWYHVHDLIFDPDNWDPL